MLFRSVIQSSIQSETASLREAVEAQKTLLMPKQKAVEDLEAQVGLATSELTMLEESANAGQRQLQETIASLEQASSRVTQVAKDISALDKECKESERRLPQVREELKQVQTEESKALVTLREMEAKHDTALAQKQESTSQNKVLNACMHLKEQKGLGVLGRLGNLGAIDDRYDVAISTACGELNSIVVQRFQDAQECIKHMK